LNVDEDYRRSRDDCVALPVYGLAVQGLVVGRDPERDGAVDTLWDDALAERERDGEGQAAGEHLAMESLWIVTSREKSAAMQ